MNKLEFIFNLPSGDPRVFNFARQWMDGSFNEDLHSHDFIKIMRICDGSALWQLGSSFFEIHEGDIILLNSTEQRRVYKVLCPQFMFEWLQFTPMTVYPDITTAGIFYRRPHEFDNVIRKGSPRFDSIELYFKLLSQNAEKDIPLREQAVISNLRSLLIEVTRSYYNMLGEDAVSDKFSSIQNYNIITDTVEYINNHYQEPLNERMLAERVHLSVSYFSRLFIEFYGIGLRSYLRRVRLNAALELIKAENEHINVLDAAFACGFTSASGFYKTLHELTGSSSCRQNGKN